MRLFAPAKLNLGLRILGRRPDGFHRLESLFWPISLGDDLEILPSDGRHRVQIQAHPESDLDLSKLPTEESNLVYRALVAAPTQSFFHVTITKRIPLGGGLGGGSSDAGTTLRFLVDTGEISAEAALSIAAKLGADIPFFLQPVASWVEGIGEIRRPLRSIKPLSPLAVWLIIPSTGIETAAVFKRYATSNSEFSSPLPNPPIELDGTTLRNFFAAASNDLETPAVELMPLLGNVLEPLRKTDALYAGMSGSGSTCFALFETREILEKTAKDLLPFYRSLHCRSLFVETL